MADNVPITPGSGVNVSTEEVTTLNGGSVAAQHAQRIILALRTGDGAAEDVDSDSRVPVQAARSSTGTSSNVAASASNVTVLAANASRLGATVYNDSTASLYLKLGATASATSFTVLLGAGDYYEVPFGYTGIIDGIWSSATGAARVTELS